MDAFEYRGVWWLTSSPEERVVGTLFFDGMSAPRLSLDGSLVGASSAINRPDEHEIVQGMTATGTRVTLLGPMQIHSNMSFPGLHTTELLADMAILGWHFSSVSEMRFSLMRFRYDLLDEWLQLSGFTRDIDRAQNTLIQLSVKYRPPPSHETLVANARVKFVFDLSGNETTFAHTLQQKTFIEVEPPGALSFEAFWENYFYHIQNFLSLGLAAPVRVVQIQAHVARETTTSIEREGAIQRPSTVNIVLASNSPTSAKATVSASDMLYDFPEIKDNFGAYLARWIARADILSPVYDLYFGTLYNAETYIELQFLSLAQAVESYHRRVYAGRYLGADAFEPVRQALSQTLLQQRLGVTPEVREAFIGKMKYLDELSLRKRLKDLLLTLGTLHAPFISNTSLFVAKVVDTRNYLTHYTEELRENSASGVALIDLTQQLRFLLEICLLHEMGFTDERIGQITQRHRRYGGFRRRGGGA